MIMKLLTKKMLIFLAVLVTQLAVAQESAITGKVTDSGGLALPGVNITIKGTNSGTQTDFDGMYAIQAPQGSVLLFSYLGFADQEVTVGAQNTINIQLEVSASELDEIVVTALGISRDKKSLGYSTQEVDGEDLNNVKSGNFVNALSGKASGIQIRKNNNLGGSTNVVIRGNASLTGSNQALFVIDGIPINNTNSNSKIQGQARGGQYDYGNAASDINPEDIESINVLKGAAASALYGSRAANGVIMITTKKGKDSKGLGVSINSGITFGTIDKSTFIKYQTEYGGGYDPSFYLRDINGDGTADDRTVRYRGDGSYGPAFDPSILVYQWDSFDPDSPNYRTATPWVNAKNGPITFFETPITITNSVSLEKGFDKGSYRLNYTKFDQKGLMPNSSIKKHNFSMSGNFKLSDKLTATGYANYIKTDGLGRNSTGYGDNIVAGFKQWWQTNVDLQQQKDIYFATRRNITWNPRSPDAGSTPIYWDNPYWNRYENYQTDSRNRFLGNVSLNYIVTDWFNITARIATDTYSELQEERRANGSVPTSFGVNPGRGNADNRGNVDSGYSRRNINNTETNYDLMLNFDKDLNDEFNIKGILGTNIRRNHFQSIHASTGGGLSVPRLYSLQNSKGPLPLPFERDEKIGVDGIYASASIGYKNMLFLDGTIRRDHSSSLPKDNSTFYYPSIAGSFVFSSLLDTEIISFGKIRANYAEVGNSAPFDFLADIYNVNTPIGSASTSVNDQKRNSTLKPERTTSTELGLEMKFLKSRFGFDVAYYINNSIDQIFGVPVTRSTGYSSKILNAGEIENKGVELSVSGTPIQTEDFSWDVNVNWSKNENKVITLEDGIKNLQLGSFQGGVTINATVGQPYGVIYGTDYTYLNGQKVIDPSTGKHIITSTSNNIIGDTNPDWLMGISNKLNYKNVSFSFLIDIQKGGDIFSLDQYYGLGTGLYAETAFINDLGNPVRNTLADGGGLIHPGVNPDGTQNTTRVDANKYTAFGSDGGHPNAGFVYDASYVKLREVALTYNFSKKLLDYTFLSNASLSVTGSNLWIIHKNIPHEDPEGGLSSGNLQGYSVGSLPTTRDFGFNLKLQF